MLEKTCLHCLQCYSVSARLEGRLTGHWIVHTGLRGAGLRHWRGPLRKLGQACV